MINQQLINSHPILQIPTISPPLTHPSPLQSKQAIASFVLILREVYGVDLQSSCPEGPGDVFHHIIHVLELLSDVIGELDLKFLLDQHRQLGVVQLVETCLADEVPSSHHCAFRFIFSTFWMPSKWAMTLKILRATSLGLR
jgi:hypothetical protein